MFKQLKSNYTGAKFAKEKIMKLGEMKKKAKMLGIEPGNMSKTELIHAIQRAEGNTPCYGTSNGDCPNIDCCFMDDCFKVPSYSSR